MEQVLVISNDTYAAKPTGTITGIGEVDQLSLGAVALFEEDNTLIAKGATPASKLIKVAVGTATGTRIVEVPRASVNTYFGKYLAPQAKVSYFGNFLVKAASLFTAEFPTYAINAFPVVASLTGTESAILRITNLRKRFTRKRDSEVVYQVDAVAGMSSDWLYQALIDKINADADRVVDVTAVSDGGHIVGIKAAGIFVERTIAQDGQGDHTIVGGGLLQSCFEVSQGQSFDTAATPSTTDVALNAHIGSRIVRLTKTSTAFTINSTIKNFFAGVGTVADIIRREFSASPYKGNDTTDKAFLNLYNVPTSTVAGATYNVVTITYAAPQRNPNPISIANDSLKLTLAISTSASTNVLAYSTAPTYSTEGVPSASTVGATIAAL